MAYADDVLCLLNSPSELHRLQHHLSVYSQASNARINFNKTEVVSLSGASSIYETGNWRTALTSLNISSWHDCRSSSPVIYLGFPLCSSTRQRDSFLQLLLDKIASACQIHKQRSLSVRGRSTVVNSLILSKLWHVLRVLTVPATFFKSVQSIISNFVSYRIFPRISFETACLPRSVGGLGLLNPLVQQSALQLRWLQPILSSSKDELLSNSDISESIVLSRLLSFLFSQVVLSTESQSYPTPPAQLDHRFFFLFPLRRPPLLRQLTSSFSLLFKAIDMIPKSYDKVVVSSATCLEIPLSSLVLSTDNLARSTASLLSSTAYTFNTDRENCLRPRQRAEIHTRPNLSKAFLRQVSKDEITLVPFFVRAFIPTRFAQSDFSPFVQVTDHQIVDISPFLKDLGFLPTSGVAVNPFTTKKFRQACSPPFRSRPSLPPPYAPEFYFPWSEFWKLPISHSCRNIWYRLIHKKLPHKSFLNRVMPNSFPTSTCPICSAPVESFFHFVFTCPPKLAIWEHMWYTYIDPSSYGTFRIDDINMIICTLFAPFCSSIYTHFHPLSAIAATLEAIWSSHWAFIFNETPFTTANTISILTTKALQMTQESFLLSGIPHAPLPHITAD
jgi:hypothetical protein